MIISWTENKSNEGVIEMAGYSKPSEKKDNFWDILTGWWIRKENIG